VSCGYRADFIVDDEVLLELKSVEKLMPLHDAQVLTYLRLTGLPRALLLNFNVPVLKTGIKSFLNSHRPIQFPSAPDSPDRGGGSA
jgi:GxxExxY protein